MSRVSSEDLLAAAQRLYRFLLETHWQSPVVIGPDPGIRFNARIYRFAKSYTRRLPWPDDLVYAQAQKYWIDANWRANDLALPGSDDAHAIAMECSEYLRAAQQPEGYWEYPNPEWRGRIATVEGNYASIGMLLTHERTGEDKLLVGAKRWYDYAVNHIGFQKRGDLLAINYFGNVAGGRVPNNAASAVRAFALTAAAADDDTYLEYCDAMVRFMASVQLGTGELPYAVVGVTGGQRIHFLCYQYNAFEFLNIMEYHRLTADQEAEPILRNLAAYLAKGITETGAARYDCIHDDPEVVYYTVAVGAALARAADMGLGDYNGLAEQALAQALSRQHADGSFPYSLRNHRWLSDQRSYPRYLSMILTHLLMEVERRRS
jgi:hypothetical protein